MKVSWLRATPKNKYIWALAIATLAALVTVPREYALSGQALEAAEALGAIALATLIACLALSLKGITARGLAFGGFFVGAGILSWSYSDSPIVIWLLLLVEGVIFAWWSRPWITHLRTSIRLGGTWLGVSYWFLGIVAALLVAHPVIAAQRTLYAGVFGLAVLAVLASSHRPQGQRTDLSIGIVAAFLVAIAALFVSGAGNLFDTHHIVVKGPWGESMDYRFWGGEYLLYHPNSWACIAVAAAIRIGPDRRFAVWQRLATTSLAGYIIFITNSRTGFIFLGAVGTIHALVLWWRHRRPIVDLPEYTRRRAILAAVTPFVILIVILGASGGTFLTQERYDKGDLTSGRTETWKQVGRDWVHATVPEKLFGDAQTARAVVIRSDSGKDVQLTTDNAAVGALRRGGICGVVGFLIGLALLLAHAFRRDTPAWFVIGTVAALPTIATTDWLLGTTGGTLWILLVAGEAWIVSHHAIGEGVVSA